MAKLEKSGKITRKDVDKLDEALDSGTLDSGEIQRVAKLIDDRESRLGEDTDVDDLIEAGTEYDLSEAVVVAKNKNGEVVPLLRGTFGNAEKDSGWHYLVQRHIVGKEMDTKPSTTFWPTGQRIEGRTMVSPDDSHQAMSEEDIRKAVIYAVRNSNLDREGDTYIDLPSRFRDQFGIEKVRLVRRKGKIRTASPRQGANPQGAWKWISDSGLNTWTRRLGDNDE